MIEWLNLALAIASCVAALIALLFSWRSNQSSTEANRISREANDIARQSMKMQEDESRIRLVVQPQMLHVCGDGEDQRARPFVRVINLSAFPVTVEAIWWKTADPSGAAFYWKNPRITPPFHSLPARLESRQALTALGKPDSISSIDDFLAITAVAVRTECGETVEGMTPQWVEYREKVRSKGMLHWDGNEESKRIE